VTLDRGAALARFTSASVASLGTTRESGSPHVVPITFAVDGETIHSMVDQKPKSTTALQRLANIAARPEVSLLVDHYEDDWTRLWWLRADGAAEIRRAPTEGCGAEEAAALTALRRKYPQYERVELLGPDALLVRIAVTAQRSWCASEEGSAALLAYLSPGAVRDP